MEAILSLLGPALFGAGTGGLGLIFGGVAKAFTWYAEEKEKKAEHARVMELTKLQHDQRSEDREQERQISMDEMAAMLRKASYRHDSQTGKASKWVVNILRLVRPTLTGGLVVLLGVVYFTLTDQASKMEIEAAVVFMATSSVLWWFGDRMTSRKK